ncbi:hypothetical protein GQ42DRAFT_164212 [Ramicandelaber brevisporus]|nr:hypothetical protein GQ42DRAFT_164212 [Ramicandelaber brevisporus]
MGVLAYTAVGTVAGLATRVMSNGLMHRPYFSRPGSLAIATAIGAFVGYQCYFINENNVARIQERQSRFETMRAEKAKLNAEQAAADSI